jgi:hypothetical protein
MKKLFAAAAVALASSPAAAESPVILGYGATQGGCGQWAAGDLDLLYGSGSTAWPGLPRRGWCVADIALRAIGLAAVCGDRADS